MTILLFTLFVWAMLAKMIYDNCHFGIKLIIFCIYPFVLPYLIEILKI